MLLLDVCGHGRGYDRGVVNVGARGGVSDKVEQSDRVYACARLCCEFDVCGHGRGYDRGVVNVGCVRPRERVRQRCGECRCEGGGKCKVKQSYWVYACARL